MIKLLLIGLVACASAQSASNFTELRALLESSEQDALSSTAFEYDVPFQKHSLDGPTISRRETPLRRQRQKG